MCSAIQLETFCVNGYYQEFASLLQNCNRSGDAQRIQDGCIRNSMGAYCPLSGNFRLSIKRLCDSSSSECRDLLITLRNQQGCCVNILNNSNVYTLYECSSYAYSLWSSCGVEPVTEECQPSTVPIVLQLK